MLEHVSTIFEHFVTKSELLGLSLVSR